MFALSDVPNLGPCSEQHPTQLQSAPSPLRATGLHLCQYGVHGPPQPHDVATLRCLDDRWSVPPRLVPPRLVPPLLVPPRLVPP